VATSIGKYWKYWEVLEAKIGTGKYWKTVLFHTQYWKVLDF
jgi:hypothetical protein